jgi:AAA+ superfamily predicted ATPase
VAEAPGIEHLLFRLALLESQVRAAVEARRAVDPAPDDAFRGLYLSDDDVERLLAGGWPQLPALPEAVAESGRKVDAASSAETGGKSRLHLVRERFGLAPLDIDLLVVALAPDVDGRFERLYGYLNDDVTRRRATIGLALELCGRQGSDAEGRGRLRPGAPLVDEGLVVVEELDRPFLTRSLRVPDRVAAHLLGDDTSAYELVAALADPGPRVPLDAEPLGRALAAGASLVYLRERPGSAGRALAVEALRLSGLGAVSVDFGRLEPEIDVASVARVAGREALLIGAGLVAGPVEALGEPNSARERAAVRAYAELACPVVLLGRSGWDPFWSSRVPVLLDAPLPDEGHRRAAWSASLGSEQAGADALHSAVSGFRLTPEQVARASAAARWQAALSGTPLAAEHIRSGALAQNAAGLERMARRIQPRVGWDDLVLAPSALRLLRELVGRVLNRERVLGEWEMRPGGGRGQGVVALFSGESGTGKTMSAEVVAGALGLELYTINLATVVDKYVGETEKNLERIFSEVDGVNGVLLFDEADALFGKRSEVRDAHDRYANIEVAYLLQRIETFDGLAILATNLRANVDEAFTRRLDSVIDFPFPDVEQRLILWRQCLGDSVPLAQDVDLAFVAKSFELSGGNIRSIALTAAYLAAEGGAEVGMGDLVRAVHREYRKLGRLSVRSEFGEWYEAAADESA